MLQFILTNILMISMGAMVYLFVRSLPRIAEEPDTASRKNLVDRLIASEIPEKLDAVFNGFLAKFLRRFRVVLLRIDNALTEWLKKVKNGEDKNGKSGVLANGIKEIAENKEEL